MGTGDTLPGGKVARVWSWSLMSQECVELYLHSPNTLSWRGAQLKHRENFTFTEILGLVEHFLDTELL